MTGGDTLATMNEIGEPIDTYATPDVASGEEFIFRVVIAYRGGFTSGHQTSACWRYSPVNGFFIQYGHEDYNYLR
jgi:hypothetical protein